MSKRRACIFGMMTMNDNDDGYHLKVSHSFMKWDIPRYIEWEW